MQLGRARLTPEERRKRQMEGRCFYCGECGHHVASCLAKGFQAVSYVPAVSQMPRTLTKITIIHHMATDLEPLIDSRADESLMDWDLARKLGLKSEPLAKPIRARSLKGKELFTITHISEPVQMSIDCHQEHIRPYLINSPSHSLILGHPWLCQHNPRVDWKTGKIREWGKECSKSCSFFSTNGGGGEMSKRLIFFLPNLATVSEFSDLNSVPSCYHHLRQVFSKTKALSLPPHRPYDCAIDLLPSATIPKPRLYSVSGPERAAVNDYISASLEAGLIRPSSSPAGAGFFFVKKKDESLRPCIDYSPLNDITIKNRYPLPLMSSVFDRTPTGKNIHQAGSTQCIPPGPNKRR